MTFDRAEAERMADVALRASQFAGPHPNALGAALLSVLAEVDRLITRRDELLALVAKVTRETPYPAELDECRSARAALIAEVGSLRAAAEAHAHARACEAEALRVELAAMRPVVEAALQHGHKFTDCEVLDLAVDAYRARGGR